MPSLASAAAGEAEEHGEPATVAAAEAVRHLEADGLVAYPTETVWGIAARADSEAAVERLRAFKGRDADKPVSVLLAAPGELEAFAEVSETARRLAEALWPGPVTLVLPGRASFASFASFASGVANADGAVGFRCSPHPDAAALAAAARDAGVGPLTSTSLNRSGEPPARTRAEALAVCAAAAEAPVCLAGEAGGAEPSTVVAVSGSDVRILREGAIAADAIERLLR